MKTNSKQTEENTIILSPDIEKMREKAIFIEYQKIEENDEMIILKPRVEILKFETQKKEEPYIPDSKLSLIVNKEKPKKKDEMFNGFDKLYSKGLNELKTFNEKIEISKGNELQAFTDQISKFKTQLKEFVSVDFESHIKEFKHLRQCLEVSYIALQLASTSEPNSISHLCALKSKIKSADDCFKPNVKEICKIIKAYCSKIKVMTLTIQHQEFDYPMKSYSIISLSNIQKSLFKSLSLAAKLEDNLPIDNFKEGFDIPYKNEDDNKWFEEYNPPYDEVDDGPILMKDLNPFKKLGNIFMNLRISFDLENLQNKDDPCFWIVRKDASPCSHLFTILKVSQKTFRIKYLIRFLGKSSATRIHLNFLFLPFFILCGTNMLPYPENMLNKDPEFSIILQDPAPKNLSLFRVPKRNCIAFVHIPFTNTFFLVLAGYLAIFEYGKFLSKKFQYGSYINGPRDWIFWTEESIMIVASVQGLFFVSYSEYKIVKIMDVGVYSVDIFHLDHKKARLAIGGGGFIGMYDITLGENMKIELNEKFAYRKCLGSFTRRICLLSPDIILYRFNGKCYYIDIKREKREKVQFRQEVLYFDYDMKKEKFYLLFENLNFSKYDVDEVIAKMHLDED